MKKTSITKKKQQQNLLPSIIESDDGNINALTSSTNDSITSSTPLLSSSTTPSTSRTNSYGSINLNNKNTNNNHSSSSSTSSSSFPKKIKSKILLLFITILLTLCVYTSFQDDFLDELEAGISCNTCLGLLIPLQALAHVGDDAFVNLFVQGCIKLGIEDEDVCRGAVGTQAPILAHDLRSISLASYSAKHFCSTVFGLCPLQKVIPYSVQFIEINSEEEENKDGTMMKIEGREGEVKIGKKGKKEWISKGRKPFKVVHLSDVHIDRSYVPGSDSICSKNICCRNYGPHSIGPNVSHPAGRFGDRNCDTPADLVESMFKAISKQVPDKEFTIFTGDAVEAAVWLADEKEVTSDLDTWFSEMQSISYPAFGNHDTAPVNSFPRSTTTATGTLVNSSSSQWVFDLAAKDWKKWIGESASETVRTQSGCYSKVHDFGEGIEGEGKLKIISINTQYWYKQNFWLYDSDIPQWDPNGILTWLASELHDSEQAGQRVWIIGHMSFGKVDALRDQSNYANQIFQRYHNTIAAHFYGHSHVDEFEIAYSDYSNQTSENANGITFISGALTPASGNPVFRVYDVDPDTFEIMDFVPHIANKSEASYQIDPVWKPYYSARESYNSYLPEELQLKPHESLSPTFWHRITERMEVDRGLFNLFNERLSRGGKIEDCSSRLCKDNTICMLRSMRSENNCAYIQPGFTFKDKKRDTEAVTEPDHKNQEQSKRNNHDYRPILDHDHERHNDFYACEGPGLGSMLRKLVNGRAEIGNDVSKFLSFRDSVHEHLKLYQLEKGKMN